MFIVDLQYTKKRLMTFLERLKTLENQIHQDPERCFSDISSNSFVNSLFYPQLKSLVAMFQGVLQKKNVQNKPNTERNLVVRPQLIVGFYSVIIMRSSQVSIKQEHHSNIATKIDSQSDSVYNLKLAIETLTKIYRTLNQGDMTREIICGLLLKIRGFNNYKLIAKDLNPQYISEQTMNVHFESLKNQCPNLLEIQLIKYKKEWGKYLRYKQISLLHFKQLVTKFNQPYQGTVAYEEKDILTEIQQETAYLLNRLTFLQDVQVTEKLNIDELTSFFDAIFQQITDKIKQTALISKKSAKRDNVHLQYDLKQQKHCCYLNILNKILQIVNKSISSLHLNWFRKIRWLFNFIFNFFITFDIKGSNFHEAVAIQYSKIVVSIVQIMTNYLMTFKSGLFPQGALSNLALAEEYSIFKLLEALLYNQYPFEESEAVRYQNYQKQRKHHDNKTKQHVIDIVNFNMKSLNINLHWDSMLIKIIPQMKNSLNFAKQLVYLSLTFLHQYFSITHNFQEAPKTLLMISNAKNSIFTADRRISSMINALKKSIYPERNEIKEGIEYFCEEYFQEQLKYNKKRNEKMEQEQTSRNRRKFFQLCKTDEVQISSINQVNFNNFKKTQSYDALLEGWENYESIRDSAKENSMSNKENPIYQSINSQNQENNEIFYSINESKHEKMMETIKDQKKQVQEQEEKEKENDNQILMPQF